VTWRCCEERCLRGQPSHARPSGMSARDQCGRTWVVDVRCRPGLPVGDRVMVPGPGLRLSRAVLARNGGDELYVDTLKNKRARTVPLVPVVVPIVDRCSAGKSAGDWLVAAPTGGPLRETNWQRSVSWHEAKATIGRPELRVHDLRPHGGLGVAGLWR
jgi:hypothetical protein